MVQRVSDPFMDEEWKMLKESLVESGFSKTRAYTIISNMYGVAFDTVEHHLDPVAKEQTLNYARKRSSKPEVKRKINNSKKLDTLVLEVWSTDEAEKQIPLTAEEIKNRVDTYANLNRVVKQMDLYVNINMFEKVKKDGKVAYKPNPHSPYASQLDGCWNF